MEIIKKSLPVDDDTQQWEDPTNPEAPKDAREQEQIERQYEEAKRNNENLAAEEKPKKN